MAGALLATFGVALIALAAAFGAAQLVLPGILTPRDLPHALALSGAAFVAVLPSAAVAIAARDLLPRFAAAVPLALSVVLGVRYGLPLLAGDSAIARWFVPRSYELWLLSSSSQRVAIAAALCVAWAAVMLALDLAVPRLAARGRRARSPLRASGAHPAGTTLPREV
jgi:hypothetical protein